MNEVTVQVKDSMLPVLTTNYEYRRLLNRNIFKLETKLSDIVL